MTNAEAIKWLDLQRSLGVQWDDDSEKYRPVREEAEKRISEAYSMAINSLREHEARVLSFNELKFDTVYWIELKDVMPWPVAMAKMRGNPEYLVFVDYHGDKWDVVKYCVEKGGWRCWTSRPTEEQRKNTPWRK